MAMQIFVARTDRRERRTSRRVAARRSRGTSSSPARPGPIARSGDVVVAAIGGGAPPFHGEPGAAIVALDRATGATRWRVGLDATAWSIITSIASSPHGGVIVGGTFAGTLRVGATVVSSAGDSDGFVAHVGGKGELLWLRRLGGPGADGIQGVAQHDDRIAIAGTFTAGADLLGAPLPAFDERSPYGDAFVAELDDTGARRWVSTFGGRANDTVIGVAIDGRGRVAVAATVRAAVTVNGVELHVQGPSDGLVVWFSPNGEPGSATLVGGTESDGISAIAAVDDRVVVGGYFSGSVHLGARTLTARGGDAYLAVLDPSGRIERTWHAAGDGREEIAVLGEVPGGFIAGITHTTALVIDDDTLPAPADPASGAAIVIRAAP